MKHQTAKRLVQSSFLLPFLILPARAEEAPSLDKLWNDLDRQSLGSSQPVGSAAASSMPYGNGASARPALPQGNQAVPPGNAAVASPDAVRGHGQAVNPVPSAPLCAFDAFKNSAIVKKGGWPGVGPFQSDTDNAYRMSDANGNTLQLTVAGSKVTAAQLNIVKNRPAESDFIDLQMSVDFLLESLGAKGRSISALNQAMTANSRKILFEPGREPLKLEAGHYLVYLDGRTAPNAQKVIYSIIVHSSAASADAIKEHSANALSQGEGVEAVRGDERSAKTAAHLPPSAVSRGAAQPSDANTMREEFTRLINAWQRLKKSVIRTRATDELPLVLSGRALARQADAVKWLVTNHKYYDMTPRGVFVERYAEIVKGKKYNVFAVVRENSKFIDELSGQVLKETDDTYKVNYTVERINDRWFIVDSAVVSAGNGAQAVRPQQNKMSR